MRFHLFVLISFGCITHIGGSESPKNKKQILFLHIPKTGGKSLCNALENYFQGNTEQSEKNSKKELFNFLKRKSNRLSNRSGRISVIKAFTSHHTPFFSLQKDVNDRLLITLLRDPVERQKSHMRYFKMLEVNRPERFRLADKNIIQSRYTSNFQTLYLSSLDPCDSSINIQSHLESAKHNLIHHFDFFGLTEHLQLSLNELTKLIDLNLRLEIPHVNTTHDKKELYEDYDEVYLKESNWADIELYNFAKEIFHQKYDTKRPD